MFNLMPFYAVRVGWQSGVFNTWPECEAQVKGFKGPVYKKFATQDAAEDFVRGGGGDSGGQKKTIDGPFYAVREGFKRGIYRTWPECQAQVMGFKRPVYRKFKTNEEALEFLGLRVPAKTSDKGKTAAVGSPEASSTPNTDPKSKPSTPKLSGSSGKKSSQGKQGKQENISHTSGSSSGRSVKTPGATSIPSPATKGRKRKSSANEERKTKLLKTEELPSKLEPLDMKGPDRVVYTDGGCFQNGRHGARAGYGVWWGPDHSWNEGRRLSGIQTNNRAEIEAAIAAITRAKKEGIDRLEIRTDSQFLINCITKWVKGWRKNDWKLRNGEEVKVKEAIQRLDNLLTSSNVRVVWTHVKGHAGIVGNEAADRLARWGAFDSDGSFESSS